MSACHNCFSLYTFLHGTIPTVLISGVVVGYSLLLLLFVVVVVVFPCFYFYAYPHPFYIDSLTGYNLLQIDANPVTETIQTLKQKIIPKKS